MLGNLVQMVVLHTPFLTDTLKCGLLVVYHGENGVFFITRSTDSLLGVGLVVA